MVSVRSESEKYLQEFGLIPVAVVALALAFMLSFGMKGQQVFNQPIVLLTLTTFFYWLVTPVVSYISAKGYLTTGSSTFTLRIPLKSKNLIEPKESQKRVLPNIEILTRKRCSIEFNRVSARALIA